ncbi:MAG: hypothetical protein LN573_02125 [Rickettsia endosymbiont of Oxypoda opaca]|nr:hypothetical protein [Rickettsia endosymbiont of Oxypoda opaca]
MKLKEWAEVLGLTVAETAKKLGLPYNKVYGYMFGAIPKDEKTMKKIYEATDGLVTANDFYNITPEFILEAQLKQLQKEKLRRALH